MRYNGAMRFKTGLVIGLVVGYYYGTKAGQERYHQLERALDRVRANARYADTRTLLSELYEQGRVRTIGLLDDASGGAVTSILELRPEADSSFTDPSLSDSPFDGEFGLEGDPTLN